MQLKPFLLDAWLDQYEHDIEFNLAASTGPTWTVNDILALADDETRHRFLNHNLVYSRPAGADSLREAIAEMQRVPVESVQIVTGASEALVALMWLAAEPGANVIIPLPGFTTFSALPESLGLETRVYRVRRQQYWTARAYFSICNTTTGEILSEIAIRKRDVVLGKTQEAASRNLKLLERFMADHRDVLGWIPPQGGMTAFPWLVSGESDRRFCQAATEHGILLAPGDCFDVPSHFRLGFAAAGDNFSKALDRFGAFVKSWTAKMVTA